MDNPCIYKRVCRSCTKTEEADRPVACIAIQCVDYELCAGCNQNRTLHGERRLCKVCLGASVEIVRDSTKKEQKKRKNENRMTFVSTGNQDREIVITPPGVPPKELNDNEVEYYNVRWEQYKGYYRNPQAYFICHMIILEEINLTYLNSKLLSVRGEAANEYSKERQQSIKVLETLSEQLPDKEAEDVQDDEKALCSIYETYCEEKKKRAPGGVGRILSQAAVALAPNLDFKLNPRELLRRCGFREEDIDIAVSKIAEVPDESRTPEDILKFFGFELNEEYAMPFEMVDKSEFFDDEITDT